MVRSKKPITTTYPFPDTFYRSIADWIYPPTILRENVVLLLPPYFGKDHLIHYLRERHADRQRILGTEYTKRSWYYAHVRNPELDENREWIAQIGFEIPGFTKKITTIDAFEKLLRANVAEETQHAVLSINVAEDIKLPMVRKLFSLLNSLYYAIPEHISFIITLYQQWDDSIVLELMREYNSLFQHIVRPSHRTDDEIRHFIKYRLTVWNHTITDQAIEHIVKEAGGIPLFAKAAVRIATQQKAHDITRIRSIIRSHPAYQERVNVFLSSLTNQQLHILKSLSVHDESYSESYMQLIRWGIIQKSTSIYPGHIRSKTLDRAIHGNANARIASLATDPLFTTQEQTLLRTLALLGGDIMSREKAAAILWGETDKHHSFSDWALDQRISRLRKKLQKSTYASDIRLEIQKRKGIYLSV